ncbi:MAG TPA: LPS export ABC transporter permease LptF [Acetobacteraceae bacterium]|nr:LPS export ABC transporter permease LptF [Acetobacteraceae bacterium]
MRTGRVITRLDIYIFRQLALALIAVTGGLAALVWLTQSLRFVELVVNHGLSFGVFLRLTGLLVPSLIAVILPITTFIVTQFVYQRLAGDRELTVMRAAGLSPLTLARPALVLATLAVIACYVLNLWIVPLSFTAFRNYQWEIRNRVAAYLLQDGVFTPITNNLTIYIRSREPDGTLHGILVDDSRDKSAPATVLAETGRLIQGPNGPRVLLLNGSREVIDQQTGRLDLLTFKQNEIDLSDQTHNKAARTADMSEVSLYTLLHPHPANPADAPRWIAEAYKRLSSPLTAMSYALIALLSVLTGTFRRLGSFVRPLVAIGAVVLLLAAGLAINNLADRNNALIPLMWVQAGLPGVICGWLLLAPQLLGALRRPLALRDEPAG